MACGDHAKGFGLVCPRDRETNASIVDALNTEGKGRLRYTLSILGKKNNHLVVLRR